MGKGVFLMWTAGHGVNRGHFFSVLVAGLVGGYPRWPISGDTDRWSWNVVYSGKRGMVRAGGSASRIIGDQGTTDPGGSRRGQPAWQLPVGRGLGHSWASSTHAFPPLGSHPTEVRGQDNRQWPVRAKSVLGSRSPIVPDSPIGMIRGSLSVVPPVPGARKHRRGMRPAGGDRRSPQKVKDGHTDVSDRLIVILDGPVVRENTRVAPLSIEVEEFSLMTVPKKRVPTGEGSDGSENCVPSQEMHEGVVGWREAVVSTTARPRPTLPGRQPRPTLLGPMFRPLPG